MKMSKKSYEMLTNFYNMTVEQANDNDVAFIMNEIRTASLIQSKSRLSMDDILFFKEFFDNFIATATPDDAIYLKEGLISLSRHIVEHPEEVAEFVEIKKKEIVEEAKKNIK